MSYTSFTQALVDVTTTGEKPNAIVRVRNTGRRAGATVVQVYVGKDGQGGFVKRLAGFGKVMLAPGAEATLSIPLNRRTLARWNVGKRMFEIAGGTYRLELADNAQDSQAITRMIELPAALLN